jgi:hypothetical protein
MKGWKTIAFNVANAVALAMGTVSGAYTIPDSWLPYWIGGLLAANIVLRLVTTTPVGKAE